MNIEERQLDKRLKRALAALRQTEGDRVEAAKLLGVNPRTMYSYVSQLRTLGFEVPETKASLTALERPSNLTGYERKFSDEEVIEMRWLYHQVRMKQVEIAEKFGTNQSYVGQIVRGARYADVPMPDVQRRVQRAVTQASAGRLWRIMQVNDCTLEDMGRRLDIDPGNLGRALRIYRKEQELEEAKKRAKRIILEIDTEGGLLRLEVDKGFKFNVEAFKVKSISAVDPEGDL